MTEEIGRARRKSQQNEDTPMELGLSGKKVLITGASRGIGAEAARLFAAEGCNLVLVARAEHELEIVRGEIQKSTAAEVDIAPADLATRRIAESLASRFPDIDILVNNAGEDPAGRITDIDEDRWLHAIQIKALGYVNMCRHFYPLMQARGGGAIINLIGLQHIIHQPSYICGSFTCGALVSFTESLGSDSLKDGIRVVGVAPGVTATGRIMKVRQLSEELRDDTSLPEDADPIVVADRFAHKLGLMRAGRPAEVAAAIVFASSSAASYISGSIIQVDGGRA
jgi:NAD(P)-dependent dehydrogenase (short-subunit alcohol dehydrogenase family)